MSHHSKRLYVRLFSMLVLVALLAVAAPLHPAGADAQVVFDNIPATLPGSFPSIGFEASATREAGDNISFDLAEGNNKLTTATVSLTSWACENDFDLEDGVWVKNREGTEACATTPGSGYTHPITLNLYNVDHSGANPAPGTLLATRTIDATIPFRPSHDAVQCSAGSPDKDVPFGGTWYDTVQAKCVHGKAFTIDFDFSDENIVLPGEIIYGVAFNTSHYGAAPLTVIGPYDSLNLSVTMTDPTVGADVEALAMFANAHHAVGYCDAGAGGLDIFRRDPGCTDPYTPVVRFSSSVDDTGPLASNVAVSPTKATFHSPKTMTLTANLDDSTTGGAFIASAEYRVSGQDTWKPMTAADGSFNSVVENVEASFLPDSLDLTAGGDYQLCVRGVDTEGNTGAESCTAFSVYYRTYMPIMQH